MRARALASAAALVLVVAGGCTGSHPSAARRLAEQHYLDRVHLSAPDVGTYQDDAHLVKLANAVCDGFHASASTAQVADLLERLGGRNLPPADIGAVISGAVTDLCPLYRGRLSPVSQP